jgi:exodeoxyribonuclease VII large subunit
MHTHTLYELNEHIRRVLALNFQQPVWIVAEIASVGESRGHRYLDLVQKGESGDVIAQAQAALWAMEFRQINARFPLGLQSLLRVGLELRLLVRPEFHERYGFKLHITDIDPAYTLGQLELQRKQTIQTLREQDLLHRNRSLGLPLVLQRIAVISSETAAGLQDFRMQLGQNTYGYAFSVQLFAAAVQGKNAESEVIAALERISRQAANFDCVVIVRGGGAKLDLMAFDSLALCQTAARMPLPLLVGIGHEVDESVLDMIAHTALKTPTAVAEYMLQHNLLFEGEILEAAEDIENHTRFMLANQTLELERLETALRFAARERRQLAERALDLLQERIPALARQTLREHEQTLDKWSAVCESLRPENVLKRGFSITRKNGKAIGSAHETQSGDLIETELSDGVVRSRTL